jgi:FG-GAP repeat
MFEPHLVGDKTGVGRQFSVGDVNGDGVLDIVVGNKLATSQRRSGHFCGLFATASASPTSVARVV